MSRHHELFVVFTERVVKVSTGATGKDRFAPRSTNQTCIKVSGPFTSFKAAQRGVLNALSVHTCLSAQVWSREQVMERHAKGEGVNGRELHAAVAEAKRMIEAVDGE